MDKPQAKVFMQTYGCQMNVYDSQKMYDLLESTHNMAKTDKPDDADLIVLNTCSVREKAQEKVFSELGRFRKLKLKNPNLIIAVAGCVASQEGDMIIERAPYVSIVFGPQTLHRLPKMLDDIKGTRKSIVAVSYTHLRAPRD